MKLIDDWKSAWRKFSVQAMGAAIALQGAWEACPEELKASIPTLWVSRLTAILLVLGIVGRLVKQEPKA